MLNIIFGIIIDTFGDLREKKNETLHQIKNICFICGKDKNQINVQHKSDWQRHILQQHYLYDYFYFLIYIRHKDINECSGLEKYVFEKLMLNDTTFFPNEEY